MQVVKTCGGFGADLAAADGGEELAVKGNRHLFEFERESGNGGGKVARRIAVGGIVRPLRAGQDNGFVQTLQRKGEEVGSVCHGIRAVQHQNAVIVRQLGDNKLQPVALFCSVTAEESMSGWQTCHSKSRPSEKGARALSTRAVSGRRPALLWVIPMVPPV